MNDESEVGNNISSWKQIVINNSTDPNRWLIRGHVPLEYIFWFCKSFKKRTKELGFELELRTSNRKQDNLYTTLADNNGNVTTNSIKLYSPTLISSPETQGFFNEALTNIFTLSYQPWTADRKPIDTAREFQTDISSASNKKSPTYLKAAHQKT